MVMAPVPSSNQYPVMQDVWLDFPPTLRDYATITPEETMEGTATGLSPQVNDVSTRSVFDSTNMLNAGLTGLFTGLSSFFSSWSSSQIYDLYNQQEQLYIENAQKQAERLQIKGDIALANLRAKHALSEGSNELAVAASGAGAMSGSFVDKLMANKKYDTREELSQRYETTWAVDNALRNGYIQAYNTATQAYSMALNQRNAAISKILVGAAATVKSLTADIQTKTQSDASIYQKQAEQNQERWKNATYYSNKTTPRTQTYTTASSTGELSGAIMTTGVINTAQADAFDITPTSTETSNIYSIIPLQIDKEGN